MKKFVIIFFIICVCAAIGVGVYFALKNNSQTTNNQSNGELPMGSTSSQQSQNNSQVDNQNQQTTEGDGENESLLLQKEEEKLKNAYKKISEKEATSFWIKPQIKNSTTTKPDIYLVDQEGNIFLTTGDKEEKIASTDFGVPVVTIANASGTKVVMLSSGGSAQIFDVAKKTWEKIGDGIISIDFSPTKDAVVFTQEKDGKTAVFTQNISQTKKGVTLIGSFTMFDVSVKWLGTNILVTPKQSKDFKGDIWSINPDKKTITKITSGLGIGVVPLRKQNSIIIFESIGSAQRTSVVGIDGGVQKNYQWYSFPSKCSISINDDIVCGVPYVFSKTESVTIPDDYLKGAMVSKDNLEIISDRGEEKLISLIGLDVDVQSPIKLGNTVFFINAFDKGLYALDSTNL